MYFILKHSFQFVFFLDLDGSMYDMPITLKLRKRRSNVVRSKSLQNPKNSSKVCKSKSFHDKSDKNGRSGNITKFCSEEKSKSLTSLAYAVSSWNLAEAKEEIKKVGVVRVLTNLTEKVGSPNINGYAGGMMNYLTFTKDIRFSSSRLLSINSPWSLVDNVNQQFDLHASYDELD